MMHRCLGNVWCDEFSWWATDAQGIELCRVCHKCEEHKLAAYRPEILRGYTAQDVDERIDPDY